MSLVYSLGEKYFQFFVERVVGESQKLLKGVENGEYNPY